MIEKRDRASALFWLILSCLIIWQANRLPFGMLSRPRPGFLPLIIGIILGVLSLFLLIDSFRKGKIDGEKGEKISGRFFPDLPGFKRVALSLTALLFFNLFFEILGFLICTFFLILFLLKAVNSYRWAFSIVISAFVSISTYLLFEIVLKSNLPAGMLENLRF